MLDNIEEILKLADDYKLQGKLLKAISLYEELLKEIHDFDLSQWIRITLADLYLWVKNYEKAKELLTKSIDLDPFNPLYYYLLGFVYLAENNIEIAKISFLKALELSPENPEYLRGLAWTEYISGNLERAELLLKRVLELDSGNAAARDNLIEVFIKEGKLKEAEEEIKKFRAFDPQDWQIFQRIQQLREKAKEIKEKS
ncbi:MAG: tetratricopeptide repeat protein [Dictyoglomus sp.]|nr:tetratricopeptide repeat protein [Dictyoglomus sp.]MCX7942490.1 tetratricopeptide repeat protein [Dictyoglomaceae bacterium]MDW8187718.1 tetratricopeptide repeat protein [Dictyoglomus sp.]